MILLYCWGYNVGIGATAYTVLTETATARLRVKTIGIGKWSNSWMWAEDVLILLIFPYRPRCLELLQSDVVICPAVYVQS